MPEPTDAVLPILRRIQTEIGQTRRELGKTLADHGERLESIEKLFGLRTRPNLARHGGYQSDEVRDQDNEETPGDT